MQSISRHSRELICSYLPILELFRVATLCPALNDATQAPEHYEPWLERHFVHLPKGQPKGDLKSRTAQRLREALYYGVSKFGMPIHTGNLYDCFRALEDEVQRILYVGLYSCHNAERLMYKYGDMPTELFRMFIDRIQLSPLTIGELWEIDEHISMSNFRLHLLHGGASFDSSDNELESFDMLDDITLHLKHKTKDTFSDGCNFSAIIRDLLSRLPENFRKSDDCASMYFTFVSRFREEANLSSRDPLWKPHMDTLRELIRTLFEVIVPPPEGILARLLEYPPLFRIFSTEYWNAMISKRLPLSSNASLAIGISFNRLSPTQIDEILNKPGCRLGPDAIVCAIGFCPDEVIVDRMVASLGDSESDGLPDHLSGLMNFKPLSRTFARIKKYGIELQNIRIDEYIRFSNSDEILTHLIAAVEGEGLPWKWFDRLLIYGVKAETALLVLDRIDRDEWREQWIERANDVPGYEAVVERLSSPPSNKRRKLASISSKR